MSETPYFGGYFRFETADKRKAADLLNANNLIGDPYTIEFEDGEDGVTAWLANQFGERVGYLGEEGAYEARLCIARGWKTTAYLSFVAFTQEPQPGCYWGEMALVAYNPADETFMAPYLANLVAAMGDGIRPDISLGAHGYRQLVESKGTWFPKDRVKIPDHDKDTAIVKDHRTPNDKLVEESRKGNKGCYVASWIILLAVVAAIVYGLHSCGVF